ncbi:acyltransferase family protein [Sphingobium sp.]|uniref:acyltransferase family protein n=1 Tax=Sphingobium sp. TaxID=1912891 RepID=UPI003B3AD455
MPQLTSRERLDWPDLAKAICILLVVMMHCEGGYDLAGWQHQPMLKSIWHGLNEGIRPIRMPLFFLISGLLASGSILHPSDQTTRNRLHRPLISICSGAPFWH